MSLESVEELRVFVQIVESGSMTAAARTLGLPNNTVSRRLAALEQRLGGSPLLYRTTRSHSLSERGQLLLTRARRILAEIDATEVALREEATALSGVVRVGVPSILTQDLFRALRSLRGEHSGLRLHVEVHDVPVNPVTAGLDVVVMGGGLDDSTLVARRVGEVQFQLWASEAYLAEHGAPDTAEALSDHRILTIVFTQPQTTWVLTDEEGDEHVVPVTAAVEVSHGRALLDALEAGLGIAFVSARAAQAVRGGVRVLPGLVGRTIAVHAIYPASKQRSARVLAVVEALRASLHPR